EPNWMSLFSSTANLILSRRIRVIYTTTFPLYQFLWVHTLYTNTDEQIVCFLAPETMRIIHINQVRTQQVYQQRIPY
ncbi:hypothetical protein OFM21_34590, partial [Escherichia coli]|nr:hypothetical protein [Escherichia coli]